MTYKEKRELKDSIINIFKRFNILDHTATIGGLRDDILRYIDSLQEEPVITNVDTEPIGVPASKVELANIPDKVPISDDCGIDLNGQGKIAPNYGVKLVEEPVSEELEKAMQHNAPDNIGIDDLLYWRNGFIAGTNWQKTKEEPVSDDLNTELNKYIKGHFTIDTEQLDKFGIDEEDYMYSMDKSDILELVKHFTNWHKTKDESITEDLGEYINKLSKQFPDVSFAKLSRIAVRVANWQKEKEYTCYEEAFEDGAKWKKEQMIKDAINTTIKQGCIELGIFIKGLDENKFSFGDKVKVIVIKED